MTDFRNAYAAGQLTRCPSFSAAFRYMEDPAMMPVLKKLIGLSARTLNGVETSAAVVAGDSTGFSTSVYDSWHLRKHRGMSRRARFVKAHIMCGVVTKVIAAAEVTELWSGDALHFPALLEATAENFNNRRSLGGQGVYQL